MRCVPALRICCWIRASMNWFTFLHCPFIGNIWYLEFFLHAVLGDYGTDWPRCKADAPWHTFFLWWFIFCKVQSGKSSRALSLNSVVRWHVWSFCDAHQESLKNVLLIFAKLNAGIRYVQGMNEILAPLFFVFRSDPDDKNAVWSKRLFYQILSALHCTADSWSISCLV